MAGACGRSNRSQSKAMIFSLGVRIKEFPFLSCREKQSHFSWDIHIL
jgi:hypothetical protein